MTSMWLVEMFKGDFADMYVDKFPLVSMGARAEGLFNALFDPNKGNKVRCLFGEKPYRLMRGCLVWPKTLVTVRFLTK